MNKLPKLFVGVVWVSLSFFFPVDAFAITIASQNQAFSNQLAVWQAIQELGTNLTATTSAFAFRVSTSRSNLNQFNFTAQNSTIYDKSNNNSYLVGCTPSGSNPSDKLRGLTFSTTAVPEGYEDVTIDFSCRNYSFVPGHKYLIKISNANIGNSGSGVILFAASSYAGTTLDYFPDGGLRYGNGNIYDYSNNSGSCDPAAYTWGSTNPWHNGCYVWPPDNPNPKNDLYFNLTNTTPPPPPPRLPVIFIPGIGGSELKTSQDIFWSKEDGHGGTYSHAYTGNEKVWVNSDEAIKLGDDDYFDVLKLKTDGQISEADLSLTGNLTSFGYGDIDSFFTGMGYVKGTNFFIFPYDWRKDVRSNKDSLDSLIESAKTASGQSKVNLVVHSMGGLIARFYISDSNKAAKVNKLIELGVPHLGAPFALKTLVYGTWLARDLYLFKLGIVPNEVKDIFQNLPSAFQLLPSSQYFNFYNDSDKDRPYPFRDDRDIDSNKVVGTLNFDQTKTLLSNLSFNMTVFGLGEQFHITMDSLLNQTNGTKVYEIIGTAQPTLGQIYETWWITWPINLIPKTDEIYINGDDTVPMYSASLKNDSKDLSGATKIYYVEQKHADLVSSAGISMQTVKSLLNDDNALPVEVKDQKIVLEGQQLSLDDANLDIYDDSGNHTGLKSNGEVETNIPNTFYDSLNNTKHIFVKKSASKVTAKITSIKTIKTNLKIRRYVQDSIDKTTLYKDIPVSDSSTVQFVIDPNAFNTTPTLSSGIQTILASGEATGNSALDQTPPTTSVQISGTKDSSGIYSGPVTITLTGEDSGSGILRIEYSLDNGKTVQIYSGPFTISTPGKTTIQFKSIDKLGNEEIPQTITIEIAVPPTPTPTPVSATTGSSTDSSSSSGSDSSSGNITAAPSISSTVANTSKVGLLESPQDSLPFEVNKSQANQTDASILGITFTNPSHISDEINVSHLLEKNENSTSKIVEPLAKQVLGGLLIVSASIGALAAVGLGLTFMPLHTLSAAKTTMSLKHLSFSGKTSFVKPFPK